MGLTIIILNKNRLHIPKGFGHVPFSKLMSEKVYKPCILSCSTGHKIMKLVGELGWKRVEILYRFYFLDNIFRNLIFSSVILVLKVIFHSNPKDF